MTHLGDQLSAYVDGQLSGGERSRADEHLEVCEVCRIELASVEEARTWVRGLPLLDLPDGLAPRRASRSNRRRWAWAASVAVAGVLALGVAIDPGEPANPFDMGVLDDQHTARVVGEPGISTIRGPGEGP